MGLNTKAFTTALHQCRSRHRIKTPNQRNMSPTKTILLCFVPSVLSLTSCASLKAEYHKQHCCPPSQDLNYTTLTSRDTDWHATLDFQFLDSDKYQQGLPALRDAVLPVTFSKPGARHASMILYPHLNKVRVYEVWESCEAYHTYVKWRLCIDVGWEPDPQCATGGALPALAPLFDLAQTFAGWAEMGITGIAENAPVFACPEGMGDVVRY